MSVPAIPEHYLAIQECHSQFFPKITELGAILFLSKSIYSIVKDRYKLVNLMLDVFTYSEEAAQHTDPAVTLARLTFANTLSLLKHYYSIFRHVPILQLPQKVTMQKLKWLEQRLIELELSAKVLADHSENPRLGYSLVATIKEYRSKYAIALRSRKAPDARNQVTPSQSSLSASDYSGGLDSFDLIDAYVDMDLDVPLSVSPPSQPSVVGEWPLSPPYTPQTGGVDEVRSSRSQFTPAATPPVTAESKEYPAEDKPYPFVHHTTSASRAARSPSPPLVPTLSRSPSPLLHVLAPSRSRLPTLNDASSGPAPGPAPLEPVESKHIGNTAAFEEVQDLDGIQNEFGVFKDSCREKLRLFEFTVLEGKHMNKRCTLVHFNGSNAKLLDISTGESFYLSNKTRICLHEKMKDLTDERGRAKVDTLLYFRETYKEKLRDYEFTLTSGKHDGKRCALLHFNGQNAKVIEVATGDSFYIVNTTEARLHEKSK